MADGIDDEFVPELPPNADKMLFAEKLVGYMVHRNAVNYQLELDSIQFREFIYDAFDSVTKRAVCFLDDTLEMNHDDVFFEIQRANSVNSCTYSRLAEKLAASYFPDGFDAKYFLLYCVHLASIAAYFFNHGIVNAPRLAKTYIFNFLREYDMTAGGWDTLHKIAEDYDKLMQDSVNELTPQTTDSEETDSDDWSEDEISEVELNDSFLDEEKEVLSENEKNLEQEMLYSKFNLSRKYSPCSSESDLEISESPFKEHLSSSTDDSPTCNFERNNHINRSGSKDGTRFGTSKSNEIMILIENDCKRNMHHSWNEIKSRKIQTESSDSNKSNDKSVSDDAFCPGPSNANQKFVIFDESDCAGVVDLSLNTKRDKNCIASNFDAIYYNCLSNDKIPKDIFKTSEKLSFTSKRNCEWKIDSTSDQENGRNCPPNNMELNKLTNKSPTNENLVPGTPNADKMCFSRKRKLDFSSNEEINAIDMIVHLPNTKKSPKQKDTGKYLKLESCNSSSNDDGGEIRVKET